jgi:hypothetical protein
MHSRKTKWGPTFLPVPTSVVSLNPLPFRDAIIGLGARCPPERLCIVLAPSSGLSAIFRSLLQIPDDYTSSSFEDHPALVRSFRFQHSPDVRNIRQIIDFSMI